MQGRCAPGCVGHVEGDVSHVSATSLRGDSCDSNGLRREIVTLTGSFSTVHGITPPYAWLTSSRLGGKRLGKRWLSAA